jgi:hypothetical protein
MTKLSVIERLFPELKFDRDARFPPDEMRRGQFRAGWQDATTRGKQYGEEVLRRLTWHNLGYRFGQIEGPQTVDQIDAVYAFLAQRYGSLWVPRSSEDYLLHQYWQKVGGRIYVEVPIGGSDGPKEWAGGSSRRRLDGVRLPGADDPAIVRFSSEAFHERVQSEPVELIEVKRLLNRPVIGQVIAGRHIYTRQYGGTVVRSVVVCGQSDSALKSVCQEQDIVVEVVGGEHEGH